MTVSTNRCSCKICSPVSLWLVRLPIEYRIGTNTFRMNTVGIQSTINIYIYILCTCVCAHSQSGFAPGVTEMAVLKEICSWNVHLRSKVVAINHKNTCLPLKSALQEVDRGISFEPFPSMDYNGAHAFQVTILSGQPAWHHAELDHLGLGSVCVLFENTHR